MNEELDPEAGAILLVDKPITWTSFNVVAKIRAALRALCGHRVKVGHAGTLDPLASGLLVLGTGTCTKQLQHLADEDKSYTATLRLGQSTLSYDAETDVEVERPWEHIDEAAIRAVLPRFTGEIEQRPPDFSAKRFKGERAYHLARAGEFVDLPHVTLTIHHLELVEVQGSDVTIEVRCSKGTYIRSLAHDIGEALGCGAHLVGLRRTASGDFHVRDARTPEQWSRWLDHWASERSGKTDR
ncbi:MAG: tRNA pseudouridine(55) synthase TruB [Flavobacteriales bacterium]|jgi:tRNA pseudouridine55 synthase|nr:tRNA pseudouridine(55) synthase TruB [Flavobacteriales bacterium]